MLLDPDDNIFGTGTVSSSLNTALTKLVNANGWTQDEIVRTGKDNVRGHINSLIERLEAQHFQPATLP